MANSLGFVLLGWRNAWRKIVAGDLQLIREVDGGGSSHLSQNSTISHFGLGTQTTIDSLIVIWIGGEQQLLTNLTANQLFTIKQVPKEKQPILFYSLCLLGIILISAIIFKLFRNGELVSESRD